ncbi:GmrSD restriction endonuclease domain-containing protein [Desulforudis sp. 1088]|uniref:GmrSD restriction endonuclease domain-containing protein n=1 Tax=unclassified Candidatus Desulforudis TaxID=2635950 RepID=UPI003CE554EA
MDITPDKKRLLDLVERARSGEIVLPEFQRNFVWTRDDVRDLLTSVLKGYFIGSFLLLKVDAESSPFAFRAVAGVEKPAEQLKPDWLILDGQQRLTSLHYAFAAPPLPLKWTKYPYRFFLDLSKISAGDLDAAVFSERADLCGRYLDQDYQFENLIVPFTELPRWEDWLNDYERWLIERDQERYFNEYFKVHKPVWNRAVGVIRQFYVPTIEIPKVKPDDADGIAEVCAIFEKLNSTGVALSVYDLLTARLYRFGVDLHRLWQQAVEDNELLRQFSGGDPDIYGVLVLRTLALIREQEVKSKSLINLRPEGFEKDWHTAVVYMEKALKRTTSTSQDGFGAFAQKWLPYSTMMPVLAALLYRIDRDKLDNRAYRGVKKWYWGSVFLERYAGAVESITLADYRDLVQWFSDPGHKPAVFEQIDRNILRNPNFSLRDTARVNAVYRGVINLVAIQGAKDFQADDAIEFHALDDHHIFPRAFLASVKDAEGKSKYQNPDINTVLNRTLISQATNRRISRMRPSDYLAKLVPPERKQEIMATHLIDEAALVAMERDDYEGFLQAREKRIMAALAAYLIL